MKFLEILSVLEEAPCTKMYKVKKEQTEKTFKMSKKIKSKNKGSYLSVITE